jgi:hypothetical protein
MLHFDPQENVFLPFNNNLSTRILEKDHFVPSIPRSISNTISGNEVLQDDTYISVHPSNRNPALEGMAGGRRITGHSGAAVNDSGSNIQNIGDFRQFSGAALFS